jgi:hypothetical protein
MSFDRQIDQVCPHMVAEEALFLNSDRMTVRPLRPISAVASVKVRLNGVATVSAAGYHIPAEAIGGKKGPFNVQTGVNDKLIVSVNSQADQVLTVPGGNRLSVDTVADALNGQLQGAYLSITTSRRLSFRSGSDGAGATLMFKSGSTAADTFGFAVSRMWRGRTPFPGWTLVNDPNTLSDRPARLIVFDKALPGFSDYVEIDYATVRQECRRCGGLGVENDWRYTRTGNLIEVRDEALLIQELLKITYTTQGSNPFHAWYGTHITDSIGRKLSTSGIVQNFIVADIYEAFRRWQSVKRQQEEVVGQIVSDSEYPFKLLEVRLEQSQQDPTVIFVNAWVQNRSSQPIQLERGLRLPQPYDLLGATEQQGVYRQSLSKFTLTG